MQKARGQAALPARRPAGQSLPQLVSAWFQVLFHSPPGVLFTFPSRYWFTIGRQRVFSLRRWSSQIPTGFHVSRGTRASHPKSYPFSPTGLSPSVVRLSRTIHSRIDRPRWRPQPRAEARFGLFRFRSPLLTESRLLSIPLATEMFQFARFAPAPYAFRHRWSAKDGPGFPIRKSQDHRSVTSSPGLIAGSHVLHRLSTPRHPPCALWQLGHADPTPARRPGARSCALPAASSGYKISPRCADCVDTAIRATTQPATFDS